MCEWDVPTEVELNSVNQLIVSRDSGSSGSPLCYDIQVLRIAIWRLDGDRDDCWEGLVCVDSGHPIRQSHLHSLVGLSQGKETRYVIQDVSGVLSH